MYPQTALSRTKNHHRKDGGGVGVGWLGLCLSTTTDLALLAHGYDVCFMLAHYD